METATPVINAGDLESLVTAALREIGCDVATITPVHRLYGDLGMDSTELVELGILLRKKLDLTTRIDMDDAVTVADVIGTVRSIIR